MFPDRWHTQRPNNAISCFTSKVSIVLCRTCEQNGNVKAKAGMPCRRGKVQYQYVSEFKWGRMVGLHKGGLSYHDILANTGHVAKIMWNQRIEADLTQR